MAILQEERSKEEPPQQTKDEDEDEDAKVEPPAVRCQECDATFPGQNLLIKHALDVHAASVAASSSSSSGLHRCPRCDRSYRHARDLRVHRERLCPAEVGLRAAVACPHCDRSYAAGHLKNHISHAHYCR